MEKPFLSIFTVPVTPFQQNCRILVESNAKVAMVVDPGGDIDSVETALKDVPVDSIFLTHAHLDHGGGVQELVKRLEAKQGAKPTLYTCGTEEKFMRETLSQQGRMFGVAGHEFQNVPEPDVILEDDALVSLGSIQGKALFTPGHSPGHFALFFDIGKFALEEYDGSLHKVSAPVLIAGDTLFSGSIGRTDLPGGDHPTLISSIKSKLLTLDDTTVVLPGHGPATTIKHERDTNPFLRGA